MAGRKPWLVRCTHTYGCNLTVNKVYEVAWWNGRSPVVQGDDGQYSEFICSKWEPATRRRRYVAWKPVSGEILAREPWRR